MSFKASSLLVGLTLTTITLLGEQSIAIVPEKHLDLMFSYCMDCHDADTQKGKVNLEDLPLEVNTLQHAELWQKVLDVLNSGEMPPENKKQPAKVAKADFLEDLAKTMVFARKKLSDSGGQITMRRLNRREYRNTIQSLTGVSLNVDSLPADGGSGAFDTVGASQYISSDQFEQYLNWGVPRWMKPLKDSKYRRKTISSSELNRKRPSTSEKKNPCFALKRVPNGFMTGRRKWIRQPLLQKIVSTWRIFVRNTPLLN